MTEELNLGNVFDYEPVAIPEVEPKEMIGKFKGVIQKTEVTKGDSSGREWTRVSITLQCLEDGFENRLAFVTMFLGSEPPMYGNQDKTQTEVFLDTIKTAELDFKHGSQDEFVASLDGLAGQECYFKSWHASKKNDDGKFEKKFNDAGYKVLKQSLIAPPVEELKNKAGNPFAV